MADTHFSPSAGTNHGSSLVQALTHREMGGANLIRHRDTMIQMRDGDGSAAAHYALVTTKYGFDSNDDAKAFFDELQSYLSKFTTNNSVSDVLAAETQFFARSR